MSNYVKIPVNIKRLSKAAVIPKYAHEGDAGFDLVVTEDIIIEPGQTKLVKTDLAIGIPEGYELQIRPRSGITLKTKLRVQIGTVDSNYRGEIGVIVDNVAPRADISAYTLTDVGGNKSLQDREFKAGSYVIHKGDRIAQAVLNRAPQAHFQVVEELDDTERGEGGFGSSGVNG